MSNATPTSTNRSRRLLAIAVSQALAVGAQAATIDVTSSADNMTVDGACTLREAISNANAKAVQDMNADCAKGTPGAEDFVVLPATLDSIALSDGALKVTDSATIVADTNNRTKISALGNSGIFELSSVTGAGISVTLSDLILTEGSAQNGGAVFGSEDVNLTVLRCDVADNEATGSGGGIFNGSVTNIEQSTISDNVAFLDSGGGVTSEGNLLIKNSTLINNVTGGVGGGVSGTGTYLTIDNSNISGNTASSFGIGAGGGVHGFHVSIQNGSRVSNNVSSTSPGGGIAFQSSLRLVGSTVSGNSAGAGGGGISSDRFAPGTPSLTLSDCTITGNTGVGRGGGISHYGSADIAGCDIADNVANSGSNSGIGGGMYVAGFADLFDTNVIGNLAQGDGGGVALRDSGNLSIGGDSLISQNVATGSGGGLSVEGAINLNGTRITENQATSYGGGVYLTSAPTASLRSVTFENNTAGIHGGGGFLNSGSASMSYSTFDNNSAVSGSGGGVYVGGQLGAGALVMTGNSASLGGAIFVSENARFSGVYGAYDGNSAEAGGGLYVAAQGSANLVQSAFSSNDASRGAGAGVAVDGYLSVEGSSFVAGTAQSEGGGVKSQGFLRLTSSTVSGNSANRGGGLDLSGEFSVSQSTIFANTADSTGGGVYVGASAGPSAILFNSVIAQSTGGDCVDPSLQFSIIRNVLIGDASCRTNAINFLSGDPRLDPTQSSSFLMTSVHRPLTGSRVVDAGAGESFCEDFVDQEGLAGPIDGDADGVARCDLGSVEFVDTFAPTYELTELIAEAGKGVATAEIVVKDTDGRVDFASFDNNDLVVIGPNGFTAELTLIEVIEAEDAPNAIVSYEFPAPGGTWGVEDSGDYQLQINADQIFDGAVTGPNAIAETRDGLGFSIAFPDIAIRGNDLAIENGDATPRIDDGTDFGEVPLGTSSSRVFQIRNDGTADLDLGVTAVSSTTFRLTTVPTGTLSPGESFDMTMRFTPQNLGVNSATVAVNSNDADESPFNFTVQASGVPRPVVEVAVAGNGVDIADNDISPSSGDGTSFGVVRPGVSASQSFTVANLGTGVLSLEPVEIEGVGFSVSQLLGTNSLAAGESTEFEVTFSPAVENDFAATVSFSNGDSDESPFNFVIAGEAVSNQAPVVEDDTFMIFDDVPAGELVGRVVATDLDTSGGIPETGAYEILAGDEFSTFSIDDDGVIRVAEPLQLDQDYSLTIAVTDTEGLSGFGTIEVRVVKAQSDVLFASGFE